MIESDYYETFFKDHPLIGTLIHECFKDLFLLIDESTAVFDSTAQEQYKEKIPSLVDRILRKYLREGHSLLSPVWEEIRFFITEHLCTFIGVEAGTFPDFSLESVERNFYASLEQNSIILKGRIDRISVYEDQRCLVDYKKIQSIPGRVKSCRCSSGIFSAFSTFCLRKQRENQLVPHLIMILPETDMLRFFPNNRGGRCFHVKMLLTELRR